MQLNAKTFGAGDPLVVLHGLFGMLDNWQTLARRFAERRMTTLLDLPNHGKSPHTEQTSYPAMASELATYLGDHWMHECDLLGHSMGGKVAMQYALTYPDRVRKLVVVDMTPRQYPRGHDAIFAALEAVDLTSALSRKHVETTLSAYIDEPGIRLFLMKNLTRIAEGGFRWKMNLPVLRANYEAILSPVSGEPWDGEALFVRGANSGYVRDEDRDRVQQLFPRARLVTIADAGHWVHAEQPVALFEAVESFLKE